MNKTTYMLTLSYEGSAFKGWHTQIDVPTVQGTLNAVLSELYKQKVVVWGAGRTDSGAHALQYTAHYRVHHDLLPLNKILPILNSKIPSEIRIYNVCETDNKFHATFSCLARSYCYVIYLGDILPPRFYKRVYHHYKNIDIKSIKHILSLFTGTHDFARFCYGYSAQEREKKTTVRRIDHIRVKQLGHYVVFFIKGEGFLRGMIRTLIGTALSVSDGNLSIDDIQDALTGKELPKGLWKPVPAEGLYFKRAHY
ncbi:MAG: tRNA pseudouridine(38-40) synthase TruA [Brevinema sp.]